MKKVLFMLSSMNIGGVEKSLLSLLNTLSPEEYEITILLLEKKGGFLNYLPSWVKVIEAEWYSKIRTVLFESPYANINKYWENQSYSAMIDFSWRYLQTKYTNNRWHYYKHILRNIPRLDEAYDVAIAYTSPTELIDCYISETVQARHKISWIHFDMSQMKIGRAHV